MKRVLIIVYYWPPSGGAGVQRWLKFSKYLPELGWKPIIYTPENPDFALQDESLLKEIHPEVEVLKKRIWEPYTFYRGLFAKKSDKQLSTGVKDQNSWKSKLANWIRGNLFIPDPKKYWRKPSVEFLEEYLKDQPVDAIISSGTPHSMHLIALDLKKRLGIPWIADFRDPWSELDMLSDYHIRPANMRKYQNLEKQVLSTADLVITTSKVWTADFRRLGAKRAECITNGYDEVDFKQSVEPYPEFVLSHFGLLNHLRNPKQLWVVLDQLLQKNESFAKRFRLHLGGIIDKEILLQIQQFPHLSKHLKVFPYLSHDEVIKEYLKSSMLLLLLFNSDSGRGNIPGKLFEYLASKKAILAFGPDRGDSAEIVDQSGGSYQLYAEDNSDEIERFILSCFHSEQKHEIDASSYSRRNLTKRLQLFLNELTTE